MSETLLDRALRNFKAAQVNYQYRTDDEFFLNLTGYLLQQATELALKHVLEINGIKYPRTHNIDELLGLLPVSLGYRLDNLFMMSGTITNWESKSRYIKNYFLEERQIKLGFSVVEEFLRDVGVSHLNDSVSANKVSCMELDRD